MVPANILNSSLRQLTGGGPSAWDLGEGLATTQCKSLTCYLFLNNLQNGLILWDDVFGLFYILLH
jgi:hypothetical protein